MSYAEDENYDGYALEVDAENDSLQHALTDAIKKLAKAVAAERERCAKVCEEFYSVENIAQKCAEAIRKGE
jgi:hypothetical protein